MAEKIKISQVVVVEGKYDAIKLDSIIDGLIIAVNGFYIYSDEETKNLLKNLGRKNGILLITDSDTRGFKIRNYIQNICKDSDIINVYIPQIKGKESRKNKYSKEGFLGVEGVDISVIRKALLDSGIIGEQTKSEREKLTYTDLFELGLSGTENSNANREIVCKFFNIPNKLSKKSFLEVLNRMTDKEQLNKILKEKPVLFWDFHGTLTLPDNQWVDAAVGLCHTYFPEMNIPDENIVENLYGKCLPWWTFPDRDTRHLVADDGWWKSCNEEFIKMYVNSGLSKEQAEKISPLIREYIVDSKNHRLYDDTISVLKELRARGYKNYILSNNFPEVPNLVDDLGLSQFFDGYIVSALVGYDKPRKEIFEYAQNLAGNPARCIMIGDNPHDDIMGAKNSGFDTILVNDRHHGYNGEYCDYICKTLTDILNVLR